MAETDTKAEGVRAMPGRLLTALAMIGGMVLFAIMLLVSYSVFRRYAPASWISAIAMVVKLRDLCRRTEWQHRRQSLGRLV